MSKLKDLSSQITKSLDNLLPKDVHCVVVLIDTSEQDVCTISDLPDDQVKVLLEEGLLTLEEPDESDDIKKTIFN